MSCPLVTYSLLACDLMMLTLSFAWAAMAPTGATAPSTPSLFGGGLPRGKAGGHKAPAFDVAEKSETAR